MAKDSLDAILELTPSRKMTVQVAGESADAAQGQKGKQAAVIEVTSFRFGSAKALAKARAQDQQQKALDEIAVTPDADKGGQKPGQKPGKTESREIRNAQDRSAPRTGTVEGDYRFQITKQLERSSPFLAQAFFSNSFKPKRHDYNSFAEAKVTFRKLGHSRSTPKDYLTLTFRGVYIVGYEMETQGEDPPEETVEFCFQTCEMKYKLQAQSGEMQVANVKGWNFVTQKEMAS